MALDFQGFIDESISSEELVLGGYIAPASVWAKFSKDWEELLPLAMKGKDGSFYFKMSEMAVHKMDQVRAFYNVIDQYPDLVPISLRINLEDLESAKRRLADFANTMGWSVHLNNWANPYYLAFRLLLDNFHIHPIPMEKIPAGEPINFVFDERAEKKFILAAWNEIVERIADDIKHPLGSSPRFENDKRFLPLQAADLWAWWVREWYEEDNHHPPAKMNQLDFGTWRGKNRKKLVMTAFEDQLFKVLLAICVSNLAEGNVDPITAAKLRGDL
ncbi:DUF3800 domain-containing protein [Bradyrhizobium sp. SZCCHNR1075]|uniref:DUF3800 domain-containing protein n=1 Tax=Bradyrhizobium sp. SZCCHNR1075 TaxID=3057362 RepID=UPI0028ED2B91|nr:DUF3800 domain-containing protein [Bradyrhizobium sp. SZCCHNR1075]